MKKILPLTTIFDLILIDQVTKYLARNYLENKIEVFSFFSLNFVENEGIAFSLPVARYIIIPLTILVICWLGIEIYKTYNKKHTNYYLQYSYVLIFAGATGNLIDRVIYSKVTDFLSVLSFPVFNLADSFISVGVALFIFSEIFQKNSSLPKSS